MAKLIETDTRLDAWMQAADHLLDHGPMLNLILEIDSPPSGGGEDAIDRFLIGENELPTDTIAETIFPAVEYSRRGLRGVLDFYPEEVHPAIRKHQPGHWGTYIYRLVRRSDASGGRINPLKQLIDKMKSEIKNRGQRDHAMISVSLKANTTCLSTAPRRMGRAAGEVPVFPIFLSSCFRMRCT